MNAYKLGFGGLIIRDVDGAVIPAASGNRDWLEFLAWSAEGNAPDPVDISVLRAARKAEIAAEANGLIDAQTGGDARKQMMMIASGLAMLDKQVGRGGAPARDPKMDALAAIFEYVEAVNTNEQVAFDAVDAAADPSTVVLVHPPLPA